MRVAPLLGERPRPVQHRRLAGAGVALDAHHPVLGAEDELDRFALTVRQRSLVRPGHQRRALGKARIGRGSVGAALGDRGLDLGAPGREGVDDLPRHARDFEAPVGMAPLDFVAEPRESLRELATVDHADQLLPAVERLVRHGAPLPVPALHHVRQDGMDVELRVEVAGRVMVECRHHRPLVAGADHAAGFRIPHAGLGGVAFDPGKRAGDGAVVGRNDVLVVADQADERHGLRCAEGQVAAGAVDTVAVPVDAPKSPAAAVGDLAFEHRPERLRVRDPGMTALSTKPHSESALRSVAMDSRTRPA